MTRAHLACPTPSPGPGRGISRGVGASKMAQDELQVGSRYPTMLQDGSKDAPRGPKTASR
eukprot:4426102-Pyramimonas_sp.AAC.1